MKTGETRTFQVEKSENPFSEFPHCRLVTNAATPNTVTFTIEKVKDVPDMPKTFRRFIALNPRGRNYGQADWLPGYLERIDVEHNAQGCGLGQILTRLGMNEFGIHQVNNKENVALDSLDFFKPNFDEIKKWAKSSCIKLFLMEMDIRPRDRAGLFFNSAIASGFTEMFIIRETDDGNPTLYPTSGAFGCSVESLQSKYDGNGNMVDGEQRIGVHGQDMQWFFCYPTDRAIFYC